MQTPTTPNAWAFPRNSLIWSWRNLNGALDVMFYDVGSLSKEERAVLSAYAAPEGSILIVHPRASDAPIRTLAAVDFVQEQLSASHAAVNAVVVAGVGSSALGTAALARNVADYLNRPVGGVVSGLGMSDLMTEALGGWFVLGARNAVRDGLARLFDAFEFKDHVRDPASHRDITSHFASAGIDRDRFIYGSPDSTTLLYLLSKLGAGIELLVGHSKGNYAIENALEGLSACSAGGAPLPSDIHIVTLGAVIRFPAKFTNVDQFIGQVDFFGMMNSRAGLECRRVPGARHSLNPAVGGHLSVAEALHRAGVGR